MQTSPQSPSRCLTFSKQIRQIRGTSIHVRQEGRLLLKSSFLSPKRPCLIHVDGFSLTITTFFPQRSTQLYSLDGARLTTQAAAMRITLSLKTAEVFDFFSENLKEFRDWRDTFRDVIYWGFHRFYEASDQIGYGTFATVRKAYHRISGETFAVKIIDKSRCTDVDFRYLQREVNIALMLRHPNVVNTVDIFQTEGTLFLVLELIPGGTLKRYIEKHGPTDENTARIIITDVLTAIEYIHTQGVVHRDVKVGYNHLFVTISLRHYLRHKLTNGSPIVTHPHTHSQTRFQPENILCTKAAMPMRVKLIDFGLGRYIPSSIDGRDDSYLKCCKSEDDGLGPDGLMMTPVGTPHFAAPEVLSSLPYGKEVDLFSCGVILFWLLSSKLPFHDSNNAKLVERIKRTDFSFSDPIWDSVSAEAKSLIRGLLDRSPLSRLSAFSALRHPWFSTTRS